MVALSTETRSFLDKNIQSVDELQVLLFLRSHSDSDWDGLRVAKQLTLKPLEACNILMRLHLQGLIGHQGHTGRYFHYRYSVHPKIKERRISELAEAFEKARTEIIDYIFANQQQLNAFADAFQFRKDD